jgi:alpha-glucosidase
LPWEANSPSLGFGPNQNSWLPQPSSYQQLARDNQELDPASTLNLYKKALTLRKELALGEGSFDWVQNDELLSYQNGQLLIVHNFGQDCALPPGQLLLSSDPNQADLLRSNQTLWLEV